ncbi:sugar ABC transporter substrate-binding protein [Actinomadura rubrisoli]|uniref:Sugar ABC transporter substrate-binding protein n=1 Tax=Actinomadura rubrisoli TaxID=2530368 RepID=A0A4V2YZB8_9ACTN|nr:sugar ABC transporter substrate-binding protein [Actinomadura rubrisoli]TDD96457.1 sugar ABC transporter substrate-binding protein [Actinomadura rubrisoli]
MRRRWVAAAAGLVLLAACADPDDGASGTGVAKGNAKSIAFFGFAKANSFSTATFEGVREQAGKEGGKAEFFDSGFDAQTQVRQLQDAITAKRFGVFVVQAVDGTAVVPALRNAAQTGIAVVVQFTPVGVRYDTAEPQVPGTISLVDVPTENGKRLGRLGAAACQSKKLRPCEVAYLEGLKTLPLDNARTKAVVQTLKGAPGVKLVAQVEGGYTRDSGRKAMQDLLQAHPNVRVVIGSSQALFGAEAVAKGKDILYVGNGASRQAVAAVREGRWFGIPYLPVKTAGAKAAELGLAKARGQYVAPATDLSTLAPNGGEVTKSLIASSGITGEYAE